MQLGSLDHRRGSPLTAFVIDASVTMAWCFEDETTEATDVVLDRLGAYGLSSYDASYLLLGERLGVPLAATDAPLADAARVAGVTVISATV